MSAHLACEIHGLNCEQSIARIHLASPTVRAALIISCFSLTFVLLLVELAHGSPAICRAVAPLSGRCCSIYGPPPATASVHGAHPPAGRCRHLRSEFFLVLGVLELEEGEGTAVGHAVEGMTIGAHLAEQLVRLAPGCDEGHADDILVEPARLLLIARDVGIVM